MIKVLIRKEGDSINSMFNNINYKVGNIKQGVSVLGSQTVTFMHAQILAGAKSLTGNLISNIFMENISDGSIGVGNKEILNINAPYWYVLNYGKYFGTNIPFIPGRPKTAPSVERRVHGEWQGTRFIHIPGFPKSIIPRKPIRVINYIESTLNWLDSYWDMYWRTKVYR